MTLIHSSSATKNEVFDSVREILKKNHFSIISEEFRPWGGFFVIDEQQATEFRSHFFPEEVISTDHALKLSPKILVVEAGKRLSWQYHDRRSEIWTAIGGSPGVVTSKTDEQEGLRLLVPGEIITLRRGERHRLVGLTDWGIVAEIWQHTDPIRPSDEEDIVRLEDDFGR
ncbi:MAG: hypothetical protein ABJA57_02115 [Ginsengibacter sp.]